ncbi:MAG: hypothetical protein R2706_09540 [Acidimicrobiales bacterium]
MLHDRQRDHDDHQQRSSDTDDDTIVVYTAPIGSSIDMANLPAGCVADVPAAGSITCTLAPLVDGASTTAVIPESWSPPPPPQAAR